ncbi:MAG: hypothetical protein KDB74_07965 [Flavobacteriales bacterium]|nr:hypothetical protein [Flavobacteriales bacterium]
MPYKKGLLLRDDNTTVSQPQCFVPSNLHNFKLKEQIFSGSTIGIEVLGILTLPITPWIFILWGAKMGTDEGNLVQFDEKIKEFANLLEWEESLKKTKPLIP